MQCRRLNVRSLKPGCHALANGWQWRTGGLREGADGGSGKGRGLDLAVTALGKGLSAREQLFVQPRLGIACESAHNTIEMQPESGITEPQSEKVCLLIWLMPKSDRLTTILDDGAVPRCM